MVKITADPREFEHHQVFQRRADFMKHAQVTSSMALVLDSAFRHGGYIAGGAAVGIAQATFKSRPNRHIVDVLYNSRVSMRPIDPCDSSKGLEEAVVGDVDVFFPTSDACNEFLADVTAHVGKNYDITSSPMGLAVEIVNKQIPWKVQAVVKYIAPVYEQLSSFDLANSMVAFDGTSLIMPKLWRELDDRRLVHINRWTADWIVTRIHKYFNKYVYNNVTQESVAQLYTFFKDEMAKIKAGEYAQVLANHKNTSNSSWFKPIVKGKRFKSFTTVGLFDEFKRYITCLSDSELLEYSLYTPLGHYDRAFSELIKRGAVL